jgi:hypothetical protein
MIIPISEDCYRCKQKHGLVRLYIVKDKKSNENETN